MISFSYICLKKMSRFVLIFLTFGIYNVNAESVELKIEGGRIVGKTGLTEGLKKKYYAFQGIPFAEPPARFELAVPKKPWSGILNCTFDKADCLQGGGLGPVTGSEDCLFLSVYSGNLKGKSSVLVFIFGGSFIAGSASYATYGPDYLVDEDVVVVLIQYRLGIFGFMSTDDLACPGNLGLKDQVLALRWVKENIQYFGGDSNNVTIMGQSSGGVCVSMHLTSPTSKSLFQRAIMHSAVSISQVALNRRSAKTAFTVGAALGIITTNSSHLVSELKKIDNFRLQEVSTVVSILIAKENIYRGLFFAPVKEIGHSTAFFTGLSDEMLSKGNFTKVPVLAGFNSNETGSLEQTLIVPFRLYYSKNDIINTDLVPTYLTTSFTKRSAAEAKIKKEFFGTSLPNPDDTPISSIIRYLNVDLFVRPINRFIIDVSKYVSDTYYYQFSYVGDFLKPKPEGAPHEEDLDFIFRKNHPYSQQDQLVRKKMVTMWTNFCKFSKPIPKPEPLLDNVNWLPAPSKQPLFLMNINSTLSKSRNLYQEYLDFYERLFAKYGQGVYGTY